MVVARGAGGARRTARCRRIWPRHVQELRTTWNRSVPIPSADVKLLVDRWEAALAAASSRGTAALQGTDLDPAAMR